MTRRIRKCWFHLLFENSHRDRFFTQSGRFDKKLKNEYVHGLCIFQNLNFEDILFPPTKVNQVREAQKSWFEVMKVKNDDRPALGFGVKTTLNKHFRPNFSMDTFDFSEIKNTIVNIFIINDLQKENVESR